MKRFLALLALCGLSMIGCGGGTGSARFTNPQAGAVLVTGEDARFHPW